MVYQIDYIDLLGIAIMIGMTISWMNIERSMSKKNIRRKHNKNGR